MMDAEAVIRACKVYYPSDYYVHLAIEIIQNYAEEIKTLRKEAEELRKRCEAIQAEREATEIKLNTALEVLELYQKKEISE